MYPRKVVLQKYKNDLMLLPSLKKSNNQINAKTKQGNEKHIIKDMTTYYSFSSKLFYFKNQILV